LRSGNEYPFWDVPGAGVWTAFADTRDDSNIFARLLTEEAKTGLGLGRTSSAWLVMLQFSAEKKIIACDLLSIDVKNEQSSESVPRVPVARRLRLWRLNHGDALRVPVLTLEFAASRETCERPARQIDNHHSCDIDT
jgi:hypothetical protein